MTDSRRQLDGHRMRWFYMRGAPRQQKGYLPFWKKESQSGQHENEKIDGEGGRITGLKGNRPNAVGDCRESSGGSPPSFHGGAKKQREKLERILQACKERLIIKRKEKKRIRGYSSMKR
jgi:hypothetical protein